MAKRSFSYYEKNRERLMNVGDLIPDFTFTATNGLQAKLSDYRGQNVVLYFYPKDATPGCTTEGQNFRDAYPQFRNLNTQIFGISRDSLKSHENFKAKQNFPFELITDNDEHLCQMFDVIKMKSMYGKQVRGIERSTFLIDAEGKLKKEWRKLSVQGHIDEVLSSLK